MPKFLPRTSHPSSFFVLSLPPGIVAGFLVDALGWRLAQAGVSTEAIAGMVSIAIIPLATQFIWAPLFDVLLTAKHWYVISVLACAAAVAGLTALPVTGHDVNAFQLLGLGCGVAATGVSITVSRLIAHDTETGAQGRAAGFSQAGNLGGTALGGGCGLWLAQHLGSAASGAVLATLCLLCGAALLAVENPRPMAEAKRLRARVLDIAVDAGQVLRSADGWRALVLCLLPMGTGAATGIWAAVAGDWGASSDQVALVTGAGNGVAGCLGALLGGEICARHNRRLAYVWFGALQAGCLLLMAAAPLTPSWFMIFTFAYSLTWGMAYAGLAAVVLAAIKRGAAATKYTAMMSLANVPFGLLIATDGWTHTHFNVRTMLLTEAAIGGAASVFIALLLRVTSLHSLRGQLLTAG